MCRIRVSYFLNLIITGFSRQAVAILKELKAEFGTFDIFTDEKVRQDLKIYSKWPTYPQVRSFPQLLMNVSTLLMIFTALHQRRTNWWARYYERNGCKWRSGRNVAQDWHFGRTVIVIQMLRVIAR